MINQEQAGIKLSEAGQDNNTSMEKGNITGLEWSQRLSLKKGWDTLCARTEQLNEANKEGQLKN